MPVHALDHVNIVTDQLEQTADFFAEVLGLTKRARPDFGMKGYWLSDLSGQAIIHLMEYVPGSATVAGHVPGDKTAAVHHVALRCTGFAEMLDRLARLGVEHRVNDRTYGDQRQIFISDPNNVSLELNFAGD